MGSRLSSDPDFFHKVHRVQVEDLKTYALLDAEFDNRHDSSRTDQQIIDSLKQYDPFKWNNRGEPDPIHAYISTDDFNRFLVLVIDSGRHRAAASLQSGKDY